VSSDDLHYELEKLLARSRKQRVAAVDLAAEIDRLRRLIEQDEEARPRRITPEPSTTPEVSTAIPQPDLARPPSAAPPPVEDLLTQRIVLAPENTSATVELPDHPADTQNLVSQPVDLGNLAPLIAPDLPADQTDRA